MTYTLDALRKQLNQAYANYDQAIPGVDDIDYLLNRIIELEAKINGYSDELLKQAVRNIVRK